LNFIKGDIYCETFPPLMPNVLQLVS